MNVIKLTKLPMLTDAAMGPPEARAPKLLCGALSFFGKNDCTG